MYFSKARYAFPLLSIAICLVGLAEAAPGTLPQFGTLLCVVGDVSSSSGRVLVDVTDESVLDNSTEVAVRVFSNGEERLLPSDTFEFAQKLTLNARAQVWTIRGLLAQTQIRVEFEVSPGDVSDAIFTTFSDSVPTSFRFLAVSCNRADEDHDDSFVQQLLEEDDERRDAMIHLGDQIYADSITNDWDDGGRSLSEEELLQQVRATYRRTWTRPAMRRLLRRGPNWMIPDDHEFISNVDMECVDPSSPLQKRTMAMASRTAFLEYQVQLRADVFDEDGVVVAAEDRAYFHRRIGAVVLLFVDTRYQRSYHYEESHPYLGSQQTRELYEAIERFGNDPSVKQMLVLSSIPLMFTTTLLARLAFAVEREKFSSHPDFIKENDALLDRLLPFAHKAVLVGGDVHMFLEAEICRSGSDLCLRQWVTSGISSTSTIAIHPIGFPFHLLSVYASSRTVGNWSYRPSRSFISSNAIAMEVSVDASLSVEPILTTDLSLSVWLPNAIFTGVGNAIVDVHPYAVFTAVVIAPATLLLSRRFLYGTSLIKNLARFSSSLAGLSRRI